MIWCLEIGVSSAGRWVMGKCAEDLTGLSLAPNVRINADLRRTNAELRRRISSA